MKGYKYLVKNMGLLTISNFGTKLLSFFLVLLYTNILTTEEYGTYDLLNTSIGILVPFLTLNIMDSVLRFSIDEESDTIGIISIGFRVFGIGFIPLIMFTVINYIFGFIPIFRDYAILLLLMYIFSALIGIITSFARGMDRIVDISISGVLCTIAIIGFNVLFLVIFKLGILGYFFANIFGVAIQCIYLFIRTKIWRYIKFSYKNPSLQKEMLAYSKPMIANSVAWWINGASDRYIVTWICGIAENGIYSVGYKIPSILNIFQTIFSQAWTLSAAHDFDPDDKNGFFSKIYNLYNLGMTLICSVLIISTRILARFLYAKDFFIAWKYVPILMIAIVFGSMSGYIGGIFSAVKNSKIFARSTIVGALVNICLNVILVQWIGALGAAIATAVSYWIVWVIRVIHMKKYLKIKLYLVRDYIVYFILIMQTVILLIFTQETIALYLTEIVLLLINIILFHREIKNLVSSVLAKINV